MKLTIWVDMTSISLGSLGEATITAEQVNGEQGQRSKEFGDVTLKLAGQVSESEGWYFDEVNPQTWS